MSWERRRQDYLKEKLRATVGRRGLRKGRPSTETVINQRYCLTHSKPVLPHLPPIIQISHKYCFSVMLESSFHVPFSYSYNGSPVNSRNKLNLHKLPAASAWIPLIRLHLPFWILRFMCFISPASQTVRCNNQEVVLVSELYVWFGVQYNM